ncbi:helicase associated domain-containing protein [Streptomyces sp. NPDC058655]|uniref:helicase associated domain-containing protein n=1 Tax=Streptomyces sp. NPDC058655 TaxID=3346577 RepID=UPI003652D9CF
MDGGEALPTTAGEVVRQGEDLGRWVTSVRLGWDQLTGVQQWMCEQVLGIEPATEEKKPKPRTSQADKRAMHYAAAEQFFAREGHLTVPRKHVETITLGGDGQAQRDVQLKLGTWVDNQRRRAATLTPERMEQLSRSGCGGPDDRRCRHRCRRARGRLSARTPAPLAASGQLQKRAAGPGRM